MLNKTENTKNSRQSKFLGNRRKRFYQKIFVPVFPDNVNLKIKQKTDIYCRNLAGVFHVKYISRETGRFSQGFGATLELAFTNMHNHFNEKYNNHERAIN